MLRFSIRELLLLTALGGVSLAWQCESRGRDQAEESLRIIRSQSEQTRAHAERLKNSLAVAHEECKRLEHWLLNGPPKWVCLTGLPYPEWELAKQPIP